MFLPCSVDGVWVYWRTRSRSGPVGIWGKTLIFDSQFESKSYHSPISFGTNSYQTDQHTREVRKMSTTGEKGSTTTKTPADFLKSIRGRPVVVKLNSGVDYRGILACLDGYMNIAMEQTEEYVNGQLKNKYGDAFIRGNNVLYISTSKRTLADGA
ncbi:hypothetical protein GQ457_13G027720 [Hibiscus cannabinus]